MSNNSQMTYTSSNIRNSKFLLIIGMVSAVVIDALITVLLCIGGYSLVFIAFPAALLLIDVIYLLVGSTATNYRFKYSIAVWLLYVAFTCAVCVSGTVILLKLDGTVLTTIALILWVTVHAISIICAIFTALYTSKKFKSVVFTTIITLLLALACAFYAVFLFTKGFFGQGYGLRTLVYDYDSSTDSYTVSGILSGNSQKVEIEDTFNGKPVTAVSCEVFTDATVKEYVLHDNFELLNSHELSKGSFDGKSILVDSEYAPEFRAKLYDCAKTLQNRSGVLKLANATLPCNLEEGKGYIAFDYDESAFIACGGKIMPLIIGDNGQTVSLSDYALTYNYLNHTDKTSVADLKWSYDNCNGYILDSISSDSSYVLDGSVKVEVKFEKVYQVYVQSGNDTKYDLRTKQADFCSDKLDGTALDYRYVAKSNADAFFNNFTQREGFTLDWKYGEGTTANNSLSTLADAFDDIEGSTLTLYPEWTLNNPTVELQSNYTITYGDNVTFTSTATSPADGVNLVYEWKHRGSNIADYKDLTLLTPSLSGGYDGEYVLTVKTDGGEVTSLTSSAEKKLNLIINKKTISFGWDMPAEDNRVYSGTAKTVTATFDNSQLVTGDNLTYVLSNYNSTFAECINAGEYNFTVNIDDTSAQNYNVDSTRTNSLKITPLPVLVLWSDYAFTYNGLTQTPTASAQGVANDGYKELVASVSGGQKNAGTHTATAKCTDGNYTLTNSTLSYTIDKAALTVTANGCSAVYGDNPVGNGVTYSEFVNNESASVLGGSISYEFTNSFNTVGSYSGCVKPSGLTSNNYEISYVNGNLEITQRPISVAWQNASGLVYNAQAKNVTAAIINKVAGDDVTADVTGGSQTNAGSYTAQVTSLLGDSAGNYTIAQIITQDYTIAKATVTITPDDITVTYGDSEKELTATNSGTIYNDDFTYSLTREAGNTVGSYEITVNLSGDTINYDVTCNTGNYAIAQRPVTLTWSGYENLVYDGNAKNVVAVLGNLIESDDVVATVTGGNEVNAGIYTATAALSGTASANYVLPEVYTQAYTIAKAPLTVTANGCTAVYGDNPAGNGVSYSGFVNGETVSVLGGSILYKFTNTSSNVGTYVEKVEISGLTADNYNILYVNGNLEITQREVTLTWSGYENLVYDGNAKNVVAALGNLVEGDDVVAAVTGGNEVNAGIYTATAALSGTASANYVLPEVYTQTYTIAQANPTLNGFTDGSFTLSEEVEYGTTLGDITVQLPIQTVEGSWVWADGSDKVADEGTNTYTVTFNPTNSTNYKSVTASVKVTVKTAEDPVIVG